MTSLLTRGPRRSTGLATAGLGILALVAVGTFGGPARAATDTPAGTPKPSAASSKALSKASSTAPATAPQACSFTVDGGSGVVAFAVAAEDTAAVDGAPVGAAVPVPPGSGTVRTVDGGATGVVMAQELDADELAALEKELAAATEGTPIDVSTLPECGPDVAVGGTPVPAAG
ncbi:MAG: hypothetical protein HY830_04550 [Actinobacteria bacterium]|nr:hypothetical protein [Actinomycetota bacterium]